MLDADTCFTINALMDTIHTLVINLISHNYYHLLLLLLFTVYKPIFEFELITGQAVIADLSRGTAQVYNYKKIINND